MRVVVFAVVVSAWLLCNGAIATAATERDCGSVRLAGRTLRLVAVDPGVSCRRAHRIAGRRRCTVRSPERDLVSCFALLAPDPARIWYRSKSLFPDPSTALVEARRPPCDEVTVTRSAWRYAERHTAGFPNRTQLLADDLQRCDLLKNATRRQVARLLGSPFERSRGHGRTFLEWQTGQERDTLFQLDAEYLSVTIGPDGRVSKVAFS